MYNEYTFASTGQLLDAKKRDWDYDLIKRCGLRTDIFGELVKPGTVIGELLPEVVEETGLSGVKVIAVGEATTRHLQWQALPFEDENSAIPKLWYLVTAWHGA